LSIVVGQPKTPIVASIVIDRDHHECAMQFWRGKVSINVTTSPPPYTGAGMWKVW
jgi:hypothetical protein